ncbi:MAG TPA: class I SAM-dependent methyltransferase [Jatrophihabitans sp.]|nr:class I SAM-dependent methyltransferase [Jatrophihabitans sp.]
MSTPPDPRWDPHRTTLASYQANVERYVAGLAPVPAPATAEHLARFAGLLPPAGRVLEIGSGPGRDAAELESLGLRVRRTDAAPAFVERLRRDGHPADLLDVLTDELGDGYDGIWASAVLLHLGRDQLAAVLRRCRAAVRPGGVLGFSVKEGDGEAWTTEKLGAPRYFVYWRRDPLVALVRRTGWQPVEVSQASGNWADWLYLICRAG